MSEEYSRKTYEMAILMAGFSSVKEFCEYYELDYSSVIKLISGKPSLCGAGFVDKFHDTQGSSEICGDDHRRHP